MNVFNRQLDSIGLNAQDSMTRDKHSNKKSKKSKWMEETQSLVEKPVPFIETKNNILSLNPKAVGILNMINKPLDIVVVAGEYRTGKSYLLNRLAGKQSGFALGATVQSQTKGIWIWPVSHPSDSNKCLLLADTEGLGDAEKGDSNHDVKIFILALLMSSTLVYNSNGKINQEALEKLHLMANLSDHISIDKDKGSANQLNGYLPSFIWTLRDFFLELEIDGESVTADEYMEHCLKSKNSGSEGTDKYNEIRLRIRSYFKERKCFDFPFPTSKRRDVHRLEELGDDKLNEEFVEKSSEFCDYIFQNSKVKRLDNGETITGRMLVGMMQSYVKAINDGAVACVRDAVEMMSMIENQNALDIAFKDYKKKVKEHMQMAKTTTEILGVLNVANEEAVRTFTSNSVFDTKHEYRDKLSDFIIEENGRVVKEMEGASRETCDNVLKEGFKPIVEKLENGSYSTQEGFRNYLRDIDRVTEMYENTPDKGNMANAVLVNFLKEKTAIRNAVMQLHQEIIEAKFKMEAIRHIDEIKKMEDEVVKEKTLVEDLQAGKKQMLEEAAQAMSDKEKEMEEKAQASSAKIEELRAEVKEAKEESNKKSNNCFSASSKVRVKSADSVITKQLKDLEIGDAVETYDAKTGELAFEHVYYIVHAGSTAEFALLELSTENNKTIHLDETHLIYSVSKNDADDGSIEPPLEPKRAGAVQVGDYLWIRQNDGKTLRKDRVIGRRVVPNMMIRHPMTMNHTIIVDDILSSVHVFHENVLRAVSAPLRFLYYVCPSALDTTVVLKIVEFWDKVQLFLWV